MGGGGVGVGGGVCVRACGACVLRVCVRACVLRVCV